MFRKNSYWDEHDPPPTPPPPPFGVEKGVYTRWYSGTKVSSKEDAIHALRRIEHEIRSGNFDPQQVADDLDAAISQVIDI